jgi:hypothetical protein
VATVIEPPNSIRKKIKEAEIGREYTRQEMHIKFSPENPKRKVQVVDVVPLVWK